MQQHSNAEHLVALIFEQSHSYRRVYPTAHGDGDPFLGHCLSPPGQQLAYLVPDYLGYFFFILTGV
ncbi:unnamed protein product, partial [marine sediment metagenome]